MGEDHGGPEGMEKLIWGRNEETQAEAGRRDLCKWGIKRDMMLPAPGKEKRLEQLDNRSWS